MVVMSNIECIAAGTNDGYVTIWHQYVFQESEPIYVDQIRPEQTNKYQNHNKEDKKYLENSESESTKPSSRRRTISEQMIQSKKLSIDTLFNSNPTKQKQDKVWKCVYSWRAHKNGKVMHMEYIQKDNVLVTAGEDGCVRLVYVCHPELFPSVQAFPKDNTLETEDLSYVEINKRRLLTEYSPAVGNKLQKVFEEIEKRDKIGYRLNK
ncbi:hypothetical protein RFI_14125 [Reticulomyxa filosa]|uniref:Uncharacterized protein n=1 Tax=Reticulomyxa filosa TaxID=46433 RepID=X6NAK1_RETFI|nr:hypothetical protein RFI_14125 [Reticulomyxa filosa]|eukprot:ETO23061.1 hypothetical protein RFI_14125 [Reticulomyxa filosa]